MVLSRRRLAILWFTGAGLIFAGVLAQTVSGRYGDRADEAWGWLMPTIMPTLSLIIGVLAISARKTMPADVTVDRFFFRLSYGLSAGYLAVVAATLLLQPLSPWGPLELMQRSNLWLGPLQGLVAASLGAFFFRQDDDASDQ